MYKEVNFDLFNELVNGIVVINKDKYIIYTNEKAQMLFPNDISGYLGNYLDCINISLEGVNCQLTSKCKKCVINRAINKVIKDQETQNISNVTYSVSNRQINISVKIIPYKDLIILELYNVEDSNEYEKLLLLSTLVQKSKDIMFYKDLDLRYVYVNQKCEEVFNKPFSEIIGKTDKELFLENFFGESFVDMCNNSDKKALENGVYRDIEKIGDRYYRVTKEYTNSAILGIAKDITEEVNANYQAEIDTLTGLYNRRKFLKLFDIILEKKIENCYLALIDFDDLRLLNNKFGHLKGDEYLKLLGQVLTNHKEATFFRIGGDEFAALINLKVEDVKDIFNQIKKEIEEYKLQPQLTLSIGVHKIDINKKYVENYEIVDKLLYKAKKQGKDCVMFK